jgi:hypothetical protein
MRNQVENYFVGKYLFRTNDVFERARILMFFWFLVCFTVLFILPVIGDYKMGLHKALIKHSCDFLLSFGFVFFLRLGYSLDKMINFFFTVILVSYQLAFMMLNPVSYDVVGFLWASLFLILSAILQRGIARILYCCCFGWIPLIYVVLNIHLNGALTVEFLYESQKGIDPPIFLLFLPMVLIVIAVLGHMSTIKKASETITEQKKLIEERNMEIMDSLRYAKRIQNSLMPNENFLNRMFTRIKK